MPVFGTIWVLFLNKFELSLDTIVGRLSLVAGALKTIRIETKRELSPSTIDSLNIALP